MTVAYATATELEAFLGSATVLPDDPDRLLERASELLDNMVLAPFGVGDDSLPTNTDIAEAMANACCAQVEFWATSTGEEGDIEGLGGMKVSAGGASYTLPAVLAPRARRLMANAGLMSLSPPRTAVDETTWGI